MIAEANPEQVGSEIARLEASGASFDTGLMQLNSATLTRLGVSPEAALEPCRNVALGAKLFEQGYARAFQDRRRTVPLLAAYSSYNTGDSRRGLANGYADHVDAELRAASRPNASS